VRRLARALGWPCAEIRPSDFLKRGLDNIYVVADEIFTDLMDLSRTVIFFDEMDALVQSRNVPLDVTRQFLTTCMLPKLAELHDQAHSAFFVATNYRATFDEAITRPGRFDLLLFVGPPNWTEKLGKLADMVASTSTGRQLIGDGKAIPQFQDLLKQWAQEAFLAEKLDRFTYDELKTLVDELLKSTAERSSLTAAIEKLDKTTFVSTVQTWSDKYIILRELASPSEKQNENYSNYLVDRSASRRQ
jgi:SpoVK/Ycf46/Vps4 family AAA+-type ATPase